MKIQNILWYNLDIKKVLKFLNSTTRGLTDKEASKRLKAFGFNRLPEKKRLSSFTIFLNQFVSVFIFILLCAEVITVFLQEWLDFSVIMAAILLNVIIGFVQEKKAENELTKLNKMIVPVAKVYRDGLISEIHSEEVVPGDLVLLEAGSQVPADLRLIDSNNLMSQEAILTGESDSVVKVIEPLSANEESLVNVADQKNMVFKGTLINEGKGLGIAIATGKLTEIGKIATLLEKTVEEKTPFQTKINKFSRQLAIIILIISLIILVVGLIRGLAFWEIFLVAIAAAVASVPEGLSVAVTVILALGMRRILKQKAVVRRLNAAETLGSASVVCVDKTGTITLGKMAAREAVIFKEKVIFDDIEINLGNFHDFISSTLLCNNAVVEKTSPEEQKFIGSPTEKALLQASLKFSDDLSISDFKRIREIPFSSKEKIMFTLNQSGEIFRWCVKGAPEIILGKCKFFKEKEEVKELDAEAIKYWQNLFNQYSREGFRILAVATKDMSSPNSDGFANNDFVFLGFWVLHDPIRPEIFETIKLAKRAGIRTIMITGDHKLTAIAIAKKIGLSVKADEVLEGDDLKRLTALELQEWAKKITVFARVSPEEKLKIVQSLQSAGEVVAMTGDGINDAPALKVADIGIAVGEASDVTKETADLVLLDNNFRTIIEAVKEGRVIFSNIKKVIVYLLSNGFSELIMILGSLLIGLPLPLAAAQILWINLITDGFPAAALTVEESEPKVMTKKPEKRHGNVLDKQMKILIFIIGIFSDLLILGLYWWLLRSGSDLIYAQTIVFVGLGVNSLFYVFSCKSLHFSIWKTKVFSNKFLNLAVLGGFLLQLLPIYVPFLREVFNVQSLGWMGWLIVFSISLVRVVLIEITKLFFGRSEKKVA
jgi:Ca2+-transporting ATPase